MNERPMIMYRYRTKAHHREDGDEYTELVGMEVILQSYQVRRWTPKGVWVYDPWSNREKWISLSTRIAFAYATKADALASFKIRNRKHIGYLKRDLRAAVLARRAADKDNLYERATIFEKEELPKNGR